MKLTYRVTYLSALLVFACAPAQKPQSPQTSETSQQKVARSAEAPLHSFTGRKERGHGQCGLRILEIQGSLSELTTFSVRVQASVSRRHSHGHGHDHDHHGDSTDNNTYFPMVTLTPDPNQPLVLIHSPAPGEPQLQVTLPSGATTLDSISRFDLVVPHGNHTHRTGCIELTVTE